MQFLWCSLDAWTDWAQGLPPRTRVWINDGLFLTLATQVVSQNPRQLLPQVDPNFQIRIRDVVVLPLSRRRAA